MGLQEGQGRVIQDVIISTAHSMLGGSQEEVSVMAAALPPLREVWRGLAELEALREQWMREDLLSDATEQLDAVQGPRGTLLCDGVDD